MFNPGDIVKINGINSIGVLRQKENNAWKLITVAGECILTEDKFSIFDRKKELEKIKKSLLTVDWNKLDKIVINCPDCKQTLQVLKNLII